MGAAVTRRTRTWGALVGTLALAVGLVAACDGDENGTGPNGEDPGDATIVATVTADGSAEQGVTLDLYEEGGTTSLETATTDMAGEAEFTLLDAGTYDVEVTVPSGLALASGEEARKAVTVSESGQAAVSFALETPVEATDTVVVEAVNFEFTPADLTIAPNTMVRWVNTTSTLHTVTPDGHDEWTDTSLGSQGDTFEHVFTGEGVFPYYCTPHQSQGMTGTVTVQSP